MPKIIFRPAPTPPPFVPPQPPTPLNVVLFEGLTEGSKVSVIYNYWNEVIKGMEPLDDQTDILYIIFDMEMQGGGLMSVPLNQREGDLLVGYLSADAKSLSVTNFLIISQNEDQYDIEDYVLKIE